MGSKKKIIISTIISTIMFQLLCIVALGSFLYLNYEELSAADSGIYSAERIELKNIKNTNKEIIINENIDNDNGILYEGDLGKVIKKYIKKKSKKSYIERTQYGFNVNEDNIKKSMIIKTLFDNGLLDKYISDYIYKLNGKYIEELSELMNYYIAIKKINSEKGNIIISNYISYYNEIDKEINHLIEKDEFILLADRLKNLDKEFKIDKTKIVDNHSNKILNDSRSQYVLKKLTSGKYNKNIKKVSKILNIDEKLLISSIGVEQLRYLTTDRAYAKKMIKNNLYLTKFSKFSYGIGGVKVFTSRKIQEELKSYNIEIHNEYFSNDVGVSNELLIKKLESDFGGTLYAGGLIYNIDQRWKRAGHSLKYKPGVIVTLYNMGNPKDKRPHASPDMGGSVINIDGEKMYFGEIGELFYYYQKYYIFN